MKNNFCLLFLFSLPFILVAKGEEISFLKYCLNESNPDPLPSSGSQSSGPLVIGAKPESDPWYLPGLNCTVTLTTDINFHILLTFSNISLRNSSMDNLTVIYNNEKSDAILAGQQVCSSEDCEGLKFDSGKFNNLTLRFISANITVPKNVTGFKGHYTIFNYADPSKGACRDKHMFLCGNMHCISYDLVCDGHNNCGDLSDENRCIIPVKDTVWGIVIIVIAIACLLIFVPMFCFLATYGTRNIVKSVTVPNQATPLLSAVDGDSSNILTSSEAHANLWPGTPYERSISVTYGASTSAEPSGGKDINRKRFSEGSNELL